MPRQLKAIADLGHGLSQGGFWAPGPHMSLPSILFTCSSPIVSLCALSLKAFTCLLHFSQPCLPDGSFPWSSLAKVSLWCVCMCVCVCTCRKQRSMLGVLLYPFLPCHVRETLSWTLELGVRLALSLWGPGLWSCIAVPPFT